MKYLSLFSIVIVLISSCKTKQNTDAKSDLISKNFNTEITAEEILKHIDYLASDELKGRKPGSPEDLLAADYIASQFEASGLKFFKDGAYQKFDVIASIEAGENNYLKYGKTKAEISKDYNPFSFSSDDEIKGELVFGGLAMIAETDSIKWNDFESLNLKGKVLIAFRGDPDFENDESEYLQFADERFKTMNAKDNGAKAIIFIMPERISEKDKISEIQFDKSNSNSGIPVLNISRSFFSKMLEGTGYTVEQLEEQAFSGKIENVKFQEQISFQTELIRKKMPTQNVIAFIPPEKNIKDVIVVGAHYDHLGMGGVGSGSRVPDTIAVHNGADDNASGVAAVIELAQKFGKQDRKGAGIVFMAFGGEEMGLLGSKYFVENPLLELKNVKAMLNFDMLGRFDEESKALMISGVGTSKEADSLIRVTEGSRFFNLKLSKDGYGASDHASFYSKDIPVFFFSTGAHSDYHTPADDTKFINENGEKTVVDFIESFIENLRKPDTKLHFTEAGPKSRSNHGYKFKVRLGIMPDFTSSDTSGLGIDFVNPDGAAFAAGMQKGDIIIAINGKSVTDIYSYMGRLKQIKPGETVLVDVLRNGKKTVLLIQL